MPQSAGNLSQPTSTKTTVATTSVNHGPSIVPKQQLKSVTRPAFVLDDLQVEASRVEVAAAKVQVGDPIPNIGLHKGFPPEKFTLAEFCKGKKVVLMGLPGAFTPT